jgi:hypothetical protein
MMALVLAVGLVGPEASAQQPGRQPAPGVLPPDLRLVPPDALGFVSARPADLAKSEAVRRLRQQLGQQQGDPLDQVEQQAGLKVADVQRVTLAVLAVPPSKPELMVFVSSSKPFAPDKVVQLMAPKAVQKIVQGRTYYVDQAEDLMVTFPADRLLLFGTVKAVEGLAAQPAAREIRGPLGEGLALAAQGHLLVAGLNPGPLAEQFGGHLPPAAEPFRSLLGLRSASLVVDGEKTAKVDLRLVFPDANGAKEGERIAHGVLLLGRVGLGMARQQMGPVPPEFASITELLTALDTALKDAEVQRQGPLVRTSLELKTDLGTVSGALIAGTMKVREAANRMNSSNNLKRMALAMYNHHDAYGSFPPAAICDQNGKPLLSWRVAILPYVEGGELYRQFKLDEPWDSPNNKPLLARMPKLYQSVDRKTAEPGMTFYQVFTGKDALFDGPRKPRITDITDGTSNTLMIVEAGEAVPWTKPADVPYDPNKPLPRLGDPTKDGFNAAFCDAAVRWLKRTLPDMTLRALITPRGGEPVQLPN